MVSSQEKSVVNFDLEVRTPLPFGIFVFLLRVWVLPTRFNHTPSHTRTAQPDLVRHARTRGETRPLGEYVAAGGAARYM